MKTKIKAAVIALAMMATPTVAVIAATPAQAESQAAAAACQNRTYWNYYVLINGQFRPAYYSAYLAARAAGIWTYKTSYTVCY